MRGGYPLVNNILKTHKGFNFATDLCKILLKIDLYYSFVIVHSILCCYSLHSHIFNDEFNLGFLHLCSLDGMWNVMMFHGSSIELFRWKGCFSLCPAVIWDLDSTHTECMRRGPRFSGQCLCCEMFVGWLCVGQDLAPMAKESCACLTWV